MRLCPFCKGAGNLVAFLFDRLTYAICPFCQGMGVIEKDEE